MYKFSYGSNNMLTLTSNKGVNVAVSMTQPSQVPHGFVAFDQCRELSMSLCCSHARLPLRHPLNLFNCAMQNDLKNVKHSIVRLMRMLIQVMHLPANIHADQSPRSLTPCWISSPVCML